MSFNEAVITINGAILSVGESMTVRVALESFARELQEGLGDDDHGRRMTEVYKTHVRRIADLIGLGNPPPARTGAEP